MPLGTRYAIMSFGPDHAAQHIPQRTLGAQVSNSAINTNTLLENLKLLDQLQKKLFALEYASEAISFNGETIDPPKGTNARGEALAVLEEQVHELLCSQETGELLSKLNSRVDELNSNREAQIRVLMRDRKRMECIPAKEQADYARLINESQTAWLNAKRSNEWAPFSPYVTKIVATMRKFAAYKDPSRDPYEVWLDEFETGTTIAFYDEFFDKVKACVIPLVAAIGEKGWQPSLESFEGNFDAATQWELARDIVKLEGLDMDALVIAKTEHPFSGSLVPSHAYIASHVHEDNVISNVYSMLHEGGHALYEQGVSPSHAYTCLRGGTSMGIHESQSRFFENYIGRSEAFAEPLLELMKKRFPDQLANVTPHEFYLATNRSVPSLIRTEADELTYPLHVIIRYEIERLLFSGETTAADVPRIWAEKYKSYLGVDVPDHAHGALQDMHWGGGMFGYFPTYALGSAYGAQYRDKMISEGMKFDALLAKCDLYPIREWLKNRIWRHGRAKDPEELILLACDAPFDATHYTRYLEEKFSAIYGL